MCAHLARELEIIFSPGIFFVLFGRKFCLLVGMTIWLLALLLLASLAGLGYRQGAIRVAFSLVGFALAHPRVALVITLIAVVASVVFVCWAVRTLHRLGRRVLQRMRRPSPSTLTQ